MKEQILKVIDVALSKKYFQNCEVELTVNYEKVHGGVYGEPCFLKDIDVEDIDRVLTEIGEVKGYNLSLKNNRGIDYSADEENIYSNDWKDNIFTFWSGVEDNEKPKFDTSKYGKFEWRTLGARESFDANGIRSKLWRPDYSSDDRYAMIDGNYFEYENVGNIMDMLNELDLMLDTHEQHKQELYNRLKLEV